MKQATSNPQPLNHQALNPEVLNPEALNAEAMNPVALELRDIHLPDPVSWWPLAPGWWIVLAMVLLLITVIFISRKLYRSRQLKRDINTELELIKQQFQQTGNKALLARSLSVLLRRANISYYPQAHIAGLTGEHWLNHLDKTNTRPVANTAFHSNTGEVLLSAPYLPDDAELDYNAQTLINLCESWLLSVHTKTQVATP